MWFMRDLFIQEVYHFVRRKSLSFYNKEILKSHSQWDLAKHTPPFPSRLEGPNNSAIPAPPLPRLVTARTSGPARAAAEEGGGEVVATVSLPF